MKEKLTAIKQAKIFAQATFFQNVKSDTITDQCFASEYISEYKSACSAEMPVATHNQKNELV